MLLSRGSEMTTADEPKRKASVARKPAPTAGVPAPEAKRPQGMPVQFGPTKSAPGSRLKGGK